MGLFSIFRKKTPAPIPEYALLGADMHSHLIPGIDDGAPDEETALLMIRKLAELGYTKLITTPHVMSDYYQNSTDTIRRGADKMKELIHQHNIPVTFEAAAEYYLDQEVEQRLRKKDLLTFGKGYLLFELPFIAPPDFMAQLVFDLQLAGYKPVLAHPERYGYWNTKLEKLEELHDKGLIFQVNLLSFAGVYGPEVKKAAEFLCSRNMIEFVGTDCHNPQQAEMLLNLRSEPLAALIQQRTLKNISL